MPTLWQASFSRSKGHLRRLWLRQVATDNALQLEGQEASGPAIALGT